MAWDGSQVLLSDGSRSLEADGSRDICGDCCEGCDDAVLGLATGSGATFTAPSGCGLLPTSGAVTLDFNPNIGTNPTPNIWNSDFAISNIYLQVTCNTDGTWLIYLSYYPGGGGYTLPSASITFNPTTHLITGTYTLTGGGGCTGTATVTF